MKQRAKENKDTSLFHDAVRLFKDNEKPPVWDIRTMFPGENDQHITEEVTAFLTLSPLSLNLSPLAKNLPGNLGRCFFTKCQIC